VIGLTPSSLLGRSRKGLGIHDVAAVYRGVNDGISQVGVCSSVGSSRQ
jgi:hypothetical protein